MIHTTHAPSQRKRSQREARASASRSPMYSVGDDGDDTRVTVEKLGWKEQAKGYIALLVYLVVTHFAGLGFLQLEPENRAYWLVGAALVLVGLFNLDRRRGSAGPW